MRTIPASKNNCEFGEKSSTFRAHHILSQNGLTIGTRVYSNDYIRFNIIEINSSPIIERSWTSHHHHMRPHSITKSRKLPICIDDRSESLKFVLTVQQCNATVSHNNTHKKEQIGNINSYFLHQLLKPTTMKGI